MKLKVDFKTKILEWKRKYNKLVDSSVVKNETNNIENLSDDDLNSLKVGDVVQKKTGNQKHCYIVTYKEENHGICLSYFDGSGYLETISYDYTEGHWVFNSKDVFICASKDDALPKPLMNITHEQDGSSELFTALYSNESKYYYSYVFVDISYNDERIFGSSFEFLDLQTKKYVFERFYFEAPDTPEGEEPLYFGTLSANKDGFYLQLENMINATIKITCSNPKPIIKEDIILR